MKRAIVQTKIVEPVRNANGQIMGQREVAHVIVVELNTTLEQLMNWIQRKNPEAVSFAVNLETEDPDATARVMNPA